MSLPGSLELNRNLSSWVEIVPKGFIKIHTGKVEIGQGILTALRQIAADELCITLEQIEIISATTSKGLDEAVTSGSRSVQESGLAIRHACACVRSLYLVQAAQLANISSKDIVVEQGVFIGPKGTIGNYWTLYKPQLLDCEAWLDVELKNIQLRSIVGESYLRVDLPDKVYGKPRFISDIRLPGMLFASIVRPPSPGARLEKKPIPRSGEEVFIDGNFIAAIAENEFKSNKAAAYFSETTQWKTQESLPTDIKGFLKSAKKEQSITLQDGEVGNQHWDLQLDFYRPYLTHASIGLSCAIARFSNNSLEVWSHSQSIFRLRADLAIVLAMPVENITVHHAEGAGCYGHNGADDAALDAALIAKNYPEKPVRVQWTRADELSWGPASSAMLVSIKASLDKEGKIAHWSQEITSNGHENRPHGDQNPGLLAASYISNPFKVPISRNPPITSGGGADRNGIPPYAIKNVCVQTNRLLEMPIRTSSLRGLGAMVNVFAIESVIEELATMANKDSVEFRLDLLTDTRAKAVIQKVIEMSNYKNHQAQEGFGWGIGFARYKGMGAYCAVVAMIEAGTTILVKNLWIATDCGEVINPDGAANQVEGGAIQACSFALKESVQFNSEKILSNTWDAYPILRFNEVPNVETSFINNQHFSPLGVGECSVGPTVAALANAIHDALGVRVRDMPFTVENIANA